MERAVLESGHQLGDCETNGHEIVTEKSEEAEGDTRV